MTAHDTPKGPMEKEISCFKDQFSGDMLVFRRFGGLLARFIEEGRATLDDRGLVAMILSWPPLHFFAHHI